MRLNRTSMWKVMTTWISREVPLFNFVRLDIICAWIEPPSENLWPFEFSRASVVEFCATRYIMRLNRTSEWKVMTIWISREPLLFNFVRLDILCAWIEPPCEKLWPFEFLESFCCFISCVLIYYAPESNLRVKSYDHLNFTRASVVQFRASRYIMRLNQTSEWKVMTIWISREHPLLNFVRLDILCAWIGPPCEKLWPLEFLERFRCSILCVSILYAPESNLRVKIFDHLNFRELPLLSFARLDILCAWIGPPSEKLWQFEFLESFCCSISCVSIIYAPESDLRVKGYDHLNFSRASVVEFRASRYIIRLNWTSMWKVMTIWLSREVPLFNFVCLDIICAWIEPPSGKIWPFEFLESFRCSISCVSIYYAPESNLRVKSYDHLNFSRASVVQFRASRYIMRLNRTS